MNFKDTLNLPKTSFPMKANLPVKELEILNEWDNNDIYGKIRESSLNKEKYILHDGPPYANGHIHIGHALNKILKDIIVKSKQMSGYDSPYVPGWDCHGLPIEIEVEKKLGEKKKTLTRDQIRKICKEYAANFIDIQKVEFKRLGVFGEWDNPYLTMNYSYEAKIVEELGKFLLNGSVYKGKKPIYWCSSCKTALAEAEVEYNDKTSPSIYVKFPAKEDISSVLPKLAGKDVKIVIWTTTPWTIPSNLAISLHPDFIYSAVEHNGETLIMAKELVSSVMETAGITDYEIVTEFSANTLDKFKFKHPLYDRDSIVLLGEHVTLEAGTGCVHTAPGHGQDDYEVGLKHGLDIYAPVDDNGHFIDEVEFFAGKYVFSANKDVIAKLIEMEALLKEESISHSYPHCWRCKKPIIFRSTEQWFISMENNDLRKKALECIREQVKWIPKWGRERIYNMIESRPDWCISRQRAWGVPITVFHCKKCGETNADKEIMDNLKRLFSENGVDIWFTLPPSELLPAGKKCSKCGADDFKKEMDILDVWFDSGVSYAAVCEERDYLKDKPDLYLEGSDQHRGWFHSSLLASVGTRGRAPYDSVLTHGFVVDKDGKKMSKSTGNVISPDEIIKKNGAELLRLWVAAEDYTDDVKISSEILSRLCEAYRRIRNTCRFILGNLNEFNPKEDIVKRDEMHILDKWVLTKLNKLVERVLKAYDDFEFHLVYHSIHNFCAVELSSFYLDILKDRLYTSPPKSMLRRSAQSAMYEIVKTLMAISAPVLSFTAEEVWKYIPTDGAKKQSVHLELFPKTVSYEGDEELLNIFDKLIAIREEVLKKLEESRRDKVIGHSLNAAVSIYAKGDTKDTLEHFKAELSNIFIVSKVELLTQESGALKDTEIEDLKIEVKKAAGEKCERCWIYSESVGTDSEHETICKRCSTVLKEIL
jgi:isoleucyl-tRNA synthetase